MDNNSFTKKDILQFIEDSIKHYDGLDPNIVSDIQAVVKEQIAMGTTDEFIQSLADDNENIKKLLESVLAGEEQVINVTINAEAGDGDKTFKEAVTDSIETSTGFIGGMVGRMMHGFDDIYRAAANSLGSQVDTVLGEEKSNVIDPVLNVFKNVGRLFGTAVGQVAQQIKLSTDQRDILESMLDTENKQLDYMSGAHRTAEILADRQSKKLEGVQNRITELVGVQTDQLELAKQQYLEEQRQRAEEKNEKGFFATMLRNFLVVGIASLITGAVVRSILIPFEVIGRAVNYVGTVFMGVGKTVDKTATAIEKPLTFFQRIGKWFTGNRVFQFFQGLFELGKRIPILKNIIALFTGLGSFVANPVQTLLKLQEWMGMWSKIGDTVGETSQIASKLNKIPLIGGLLGKVADFFIMIGKGVSGFVGRSEFLTKVLNNIGKAFGRFRWLLGHIAALSTKLTMIPHLISAGFKWLGWPLMILLTVIDFIKGFAKSTEATLAGKIFDGIEQALVGFFELPIRLFAWMYEKAMNFLGLEAENSGDKAVAMFRKIINTLLHPFEAMGDLMERLFGTQAGVIGKTIGNTVKMIGTIISSLFTIIVAPLKLAFGLAKNTVGAVMGVIKGVFTVGMGLFSGIIAITGQLISVIGSLLTFDFKGAWAKILDFVPILEGIWDVVKTGLLDVVGSLRGFVTGFFGTWFQTFVDVWGSVFRIFTSPFVWLYEQATGIFGIMKEKLMGTAFEPMVLLFETIGNVISGVIDWFKKRVEKIPLIGKMFKDEEAKDPAVAEAQRIDKIRKEHKVVVQQIQDLEEKRLKKPLKFSERRKLKNLEKKEQDLYAQLPAPEATGSDAMVGINIPSNKIVEGAKRHTDAFGVGLGTVTGKNVPRIKTTQSTGSIAAWEDNIRASKVSSLAEATQYNKGIQKAVIELNKTQKETAERPIIVNTPKAEKRLIEPPEDIESMSVLWLNKSWGLG